MKGSASIENLIVLILKSVDEDLRMEVLLFLGENALCCSVYDDNENLDPIDT